jgi:prepilin-type processing-associated H-X9-DG protein
MKTKTSGVTKSNRSAHLESKSIAVGGNIGLWDGHVVWHPFGQMSNGTSGSPYYYS